MMCTVYKIFWHYSSIATTLVVKCAFIGRVFGTLTEGADFGGKLTLLIVFQKFSLNRCPSN